MKLRIKSMIWNIRKQKTIRTTTRKRIPKKEDSVLSPHKEYISSTHPSWVIGEAVPLDPIGHLLH